MQPYLHKVQYYETDQMGFVHHSNYIRWFEEARTEYMKCLGADYAKLEAGGCLSPVLSVACEYKKSVSFGECVAIEAVLAEFGNVRFLVRYHVRDARTGELRACGETTHCFINREGRPISLKHVDPALFERLREEGKRHAER